MKKTMLFLPLTAALLAACGSATPPIPVTLTTLTVGGITGPLKVESTAKLTVTTTGSDGNPFTGTASFTSSAPNAVAVAADGTVTVRHLSRKPVTLTVTEADKTASINVTPYGLDISGGTYTINAGDTLKTVFILALVDAQGAASTSDTTASIQGPAGFNGDKPYVLNVPKGTPPNGYYTYPFGTVAPVAGTYTATATLGNMTFSKTFTIDTAQRQPKADAVSLTFNATGYTLTGTLPASPTATPGYIQNTTGSFITGTPLITTLPTSGTFTTPLASGTYFGGVFTQNFSNLQNSFPDQYNRAYVSGPVVTIP